MRVRVNGRTTSTYHGVLSIPEGTAGSFAVVHENKPAGATFQLASMRTIILGGHRAGKVVFKEPTRWHSLTEEGRVWMSDVPIEQVQHDAVLARVRHGRVLVGGLGLGYAATILALRPGIKAVTVVERSKEVIDLVAPHLLAGRKEREKLQFLQADIHEFTARAADRAAETLWDWAFYDTWASDGETTFHRQVAPLLRASVAIVKNRPICWNEDIMRGQLQQNLRSRMMIFSNLLRSPSNITVDEIAEATDIYSAWAQPFWRWVRDAKPPFEEQQVVAQHYAQMYATRDDESVLKIARALAEITR